MDTTKRNRQVKKVLSTAFGASNVSVTGGRGTACGWCDVTINGGDRLSAEEFYSQDEKDLMNGISKKAWELIKGLEFYHYTDDMGYGHSEVIVQVTLN